MRYGNPAQPSCCQMWPPGFLTPCQDETWAHIPCIWIPWFLQGLARRELPIALVSTWPKPPGISVAHQDYLTWRLTRHFPPISVLPSSKEFRYINDSSLFWKAYRYQIIELVFCTNIPSSLCQLAQCKGLLGRKRKEDTVSCRWKELKNVTWFTVENL